MKEATDFAIAATHAAMTALIQHDDPDFAAVNAWLSKAHTGVL